MVAVENSVIPADKGCAWAAIVAEDDKDVAPSLFSSPAAATVPDADNELAPSLVSSPSAETVTGLFNVANPGKGCGYALMEAEDDRVFELVQVK